MGQRPAQETPDFTVPALGGGEFNLAAHRGSPVVLYFMAYWCGSCLPEAKALGRVHERYRDRVTIVALDVDPSSTPQLLQRFRSLAGDPGYVWAFDQANRVSIAYGVRALESTIITDSRGTIGYRDARSTPYKVLEREVRKALP